jgi:hypothetical protein
MYAHFLFFCFFVCFIFQHGAGWKSLGSIGKRIPHHRLVWLRITKGSFWNLSFTLSFTENIKLMLHYLEFIHGHLNGISIPARTLLF